MINKVLHYGLLYDYYGALLTDKQQQCLEMHYHHDLSLSEIADELRVSRQAVHDILKRAEQTLDEYEARLGYAERRRREQSALKHVCTLIKELPEGVRTIPNITKSLDILDGLLD